MVSRGGSAGAAMTVLAVLSVILLGAWPAMGEADGWLPEKMPNPWTEPAACSRTVPSWLCDPDGVIPREDQDLIEGVLKQIAAGQEPYAKLPCGSHGNVGPQVSVAVIRKMDRVLVRSLGKENAASIFAKKLHDSWGVGHAECNDGAVIFLSIDDRRSFVSTGAGLKKLVPDSALDEVLERMKPALRAEKYGQALAQAADDIGELAAGRGPRSQTSLLEFLPFLAFGAIFVGVSCYGTWQSRRQAKDYASVKKHLNQISDAQERARVNSYKVSSCPVCLEDFDNVPDGEEGTPMEASQAHQGSLGPRSRSGNSTPPAGTDDLEEPLLQGGRAAGGGKDSKSKEGKGAEGGAPKREPVALPCGHVFCETCIDEWMKSHPTCPICRKDPTRPDLPPGGGGGGGGNDDDSRRPPPPPNPQQPDHRHQQQQGAGGCCQPEQPSPSSRAQPSSGGFFAPRRPYRPTMRMAAMDIGPELVFRLGSLRRRYPAYVTDDMVGRWTHDIHGDRHIRWRTDTEFVRRDPARVEATRSQGRSGASTSFGGGSSFGGGGRGGSW